MTRAIIATRERIHHAAFILFCRYGFKRTSIEARMLRLIEVALDSPHGTELVDEKNRLCGELWADSERAFHELIVRVFKRASHAHEIDLAAAGLSAAETADLFLR